MISAPVAERLLTGHDLLEMEDLGPCELVEGVLVPISPTLGEHGILEALITASLHDFNKKRRTGWLLGGEVGIYTQRNPDTLRAVDVAFVSKNRQPTRPKSFLEVAPELVVEIVSPSDRWSDLRQKMREYFGAGVEHVWVVDPEAGEVLVFRSPTELTQLGLADTLRGEGVLAGFELPVADLFASD